MIKPVFGSMGVVVKWVGITCMGLTFSGILPGVHEAGAKEGQSKRRADRYADFFVKIPKGYLPDGTYVRSFEGSRYPVTRGFWNQIMGGKPKYDNSDSSSDSDEETQEEWIAKPHLPVTNVHWINKDGSPAEIQEFLTRLNQRTARTGCTYKLPTDNQLHYMIRGDQSGKDRSRYSKGVTILNRNRYITHSGSKCLGGVPCCLSSIPQPVGRKLPNRFGIELGNVYRLTQDLYDPIRPHLGYSIRGGSFDNTLYAAESNYRKYLPTGQRWDGVGFSLVRRCKKF